MNPGYVPPEKEVKMVNGIYLEQRRNDAKITDETFTNVVSQKKEV